MARRRFRRKDLKRPDEFVSRGNEVLGWAQSNTRLLMQIGGAVVLVALIVIGFISVRSARVRQANDDLTRALGEFRDGHYKEAAAQLAEVGSRWQSTSAGRIAQLYAANADLRADNFDAAATLLQSVLGDRDWPAYLQQQVLLALGYALEHRADLKGAAQCYGEAAGLDGPYTSLALLGEARSREQLGEKEEAGKLYERFAQEFPDLPETALASAKAAALKLT